MLFGLKSSQFVLAKPQLSSPCESQASNSWPEGGGGWGRSSAPCSHWWSCIKYQNSVPTTTATQLGHHLPSQEMLSRSLLRLRSVSRPAGLAACPQAALHALAALVCVRGKVPAPVRELSAWRRKPVMPCWDKQQQQQQLRPLVLSSHFGSSPKRWLTTSAADSADTSSSSSSSPVKVAPSAYKVRGASFNPHQAP